MEGLAPSMKLFDPPSSQLHFKTAFNLLKDNDLIFSAVFLPGLLTTVCLF